MEQLVMGIIFLAFVLVVRRKEAFVFRWRPTRHTWVAVGAGLLAFVFSASMLLVGVDSLAAKLIHRVLIYALCGVAIPWGYTLLVEREPVAAMGLRRDKWAVSLILNLALAALMSLIIIFEADWASIRWDQFFKATVPLVFAGGLFELFLYYGFIHLRLEKAFGPLPAIFVAAILYVLWHTGTQLPLEENVPLALLKLFGVGLMYQSVFSLTRNLWIIWPFFHGVGVMIDFVVNVDKIELVSRDFGWALFALALMALTGVIVALLRRNVMQPAATTAIRW
ncbi:MAG: CPBP family intramembrane metalloprotease [Anaerolineae bacterium]|nr:CPBP family intramembrane metalloprotease [Anaerolineae bacterium]